MPPGMPVPRNNRRYLQHRLTNHSDYVSNLPGSWPVAVHRAAVDGLAIGRPCQAQSCTEGRFGLTLGTGKNSLGSRSGSGGTRDFEVRIHLAAHGLLQEACRSPTALKELSRANPALSGKFTAASQSGTKARGGPSYFVRTEAILTVALAGRSTTATRAGRTPRYPPLALGFASRRFHRPPRAVSAVELLQVEIRRNAGRR